MVRAPIAENISSLNSISFELLITDAKTALTLLDLRETTQLPDDKARRVKEARHAYDTICNFLARLTPTPEQMGLLSRELETLKTRLIAAGEKL